LVLELAILVGVKYFDEFLANLVSFDLFILAKVFAAVFMVFDADYLFEGFFELLRGDVVDLFVLLELVHDDEKSYG
jgi:hypothetical protein